MIQASLSVLELRGHPFDCRRGLATRPDEGPTATKLRPRVQSPPFSLRRHGGQSNPHPCTCLRWYGSCIVYIVSIRIASCLRGSNPNRAPPGGQPWSMAALRRLGPWGSTPARWLVSVDLEASIPIVSSLPSSLAPEPSHVVFRVSVTEQWIARLRVALIERDLPNTRTWPFRVQVSELGRTTWPNVREAEEEGRLGSILDCNVMPA